MNPSSRIRDTLINYLETSDEKEIQPETNLPIEENLAGSAEHQIAIPSSLEKIERKDNYYRYELDFLNKGRPNRNFRCKRVLMCIFTITTDGYFPFIQYLLYKYKDAFYWPFINITGEVGMKPEAELKHLGISELATYQGYLENEEEVYMFYKLQDNTADLQFLTLKDEFWFGLISEICQSRSIVDIAIDDSVYKLFDAYQDLTLLFDKKGEAYESPMGLYKGVSGNRLEWIAKFGVVKGSIFATFGPYYYFMDFQTAGRFGSWTVSFKPGALDDLTDNKYGRFTKGGVVRFAIFLGKLNVLLNRFDDDITKNQVRKDRMDNFKKYNIVPIPKKAYSISDNLGEWTKNYDSIYSGDIEFDVDTYYRYLYIGASYAVKNYYQQYPLSYHHLDKSNLGEMYRPDINFKIE